MQINENRGHSTPTREPDASVKIKQLCTLQNYSNQTNEYCSLINEHYSFSNSAFLFLLLICSTEVYKRLLIPCKIFNLDILIFQEKKE